MQVPSPRLVIWGIALLMLQGHPIGNRVVGRVGATPTPYYNQSSLRQPPERASLKQLLGSALEGKGVPSNLLEAAVLRPVTRRKEPLQQFLETPYCRTAGARRVSSLSISTGPNPLSDLGADVKKELSAKKKGISKRENRADE